MARREGGEDEVKQLAVELSKTLNDGERILAPSRRPDGTLRKPIRIRAGYVPQDEVAIYQSKGALWKKEMESQEVLPPGYDPVLDAKPKTKSAKRNERKKEKRLLASLDKGKTLDKDEVSSAENLNQAVPIEAVASQLNEFTISAKSSTVSAPSNSTEYLNSQDPVTDIDMSGSISLCFGLSVANSGVAIYGSNRSSTLAKPNIKIRCIGWDPEGILGPPSTGHIARLEFKRRLERDAGAREEFQRQVLEEKERLRNLRASRVVPDTPAGLTEYFLDTEARELEFEIARLRPSLNQEFFSHLKFELGQLRFAVSKTEDMEDRVIELEALEKALLEGTEAYDRLQADLVKARESLTKILTSKDIKATLLDMLERNELNRSLLTLLDENIASAHKGNQKQAADFMEKLRGAVLKYITV